MTEELSRFCDLGIIKRVEEKPRIINPLSAVFSNKMRLVWDLRLINEIVVQPKVKLEDLKMMVEILQPGDWAAVDDLESGYYQIKLDEDSQTFLGIEWRGIYYVSVVLVLGVCSAVGVFTLLLKPIVAYLRTRGWRGALYIDDMGTLGRTFQEACYYQRLAKWVAEQAGFCWSRDKSTEPSQDFQFLGFRLNTIEQKIYIPKIKLEKVETNLKAILSKRWSTVRTLASLAGQLISLNPAVGQLTRLRTRRIYRQFLQVLEFTCSWQSTIYLEDEAKEEMRWWLDKLRRINGKPYLEPQQVIEAEVEHVLAGDASGKGSYCAKVRGKKKTLVSRPFSPEEEKKSSAYRELLVFTDFYVNNKQLEDFYASSILHFTDNWAVSRIMEVGSKRQELNDMAIAIIESCEKAAIDLTVRWKGREESIMKEVDQGSRGPWHLQDRFGLDLFTWSIIQQTWPCDIDAMASQAQHLLPRYYTENRDEEAEGFDLFAQTLDQELRYFVHPHPRLALKCLKFLHKQKVEAVLLLPLWTGLTISPLLFPFKHLPMAARGHFEVFPRFVPENEEVSPTFSGEAKSRYLAILFDFRGSEEAFYWAMRPRLQKDHCINLNCNICI